MLRRMRTGQPRKGNLGRNWAAFGLGWVVAMAAFGQGSQADYERANSLAARTEGKVFRQRIRPNWLTHQSQFWYQIETAPKQYEYVWIDAVSGVRKPLLDPVRARAALRAQDAKVPADARLEVAQFDGRVLTLRCDGREWSYDPESDVLKPLATPPGASGFRAPDAGPQRSRRTGDSVEVTFVNQGAEEVELYWLDEEGQRRSYGRLRPGTDRAQHTYAGHLWLVTDRVGTPLGIWEATEDRPRAIISADLLSRRETAPAPKQEPAAKPLPGISPDGRWQAKVVADRLEVWSTAASGALWFRSPDRGTNDVYAADFNWSPDSSRLVARRVVPATEHLVQFVEAAPRDQLQPKLHVHRYYKPGDALPKPRLVLFTLAAKSEVTIDETWYPNPFTEDGDLEVAWSPDGREFRVPYNQRGHQVYRLLAIDGQTGAVRVVVDETAKTFVDWTAKTWRQWLDATGELLWMSERDGWCHLYLYDATTGRVKNQITRGEWVVRRVEHVDVTERQIWFYAGGIRPGQDPYQLHLCRVNFDGSGLVILTEGDGQHQAEFSPDRRWFIDTWSRVDQPPVIELRRSADGSRVGELERADASALVAAGWTMPERFSARARDGQTEIFGIIVRPSNLDPAKKYPVLEEVYAGPQAAYVPKEFGRLLRAHQLAELGFIVVQVDGLGTSQRSKAVQDYSYKNLADAGFVDRIGWIQAAARTRPWMDLGRVGIYGGSAGGQNALRALLDHADFYQAAVADCGCHDNRMDKIWWNEQWLGWPVDESYVRSSNVADAHRLRGHLLLIVGEVDTNVDPASTMQVVNALEKADKDFELLVMTGVNHGAGETPYGSRRRQDFFVRHLLQKTPRWE